MKWLANNFKRKKIIYSEIIALYCGSLPVNNIFDMTTFNKIWKILTVEQHKNAVILLFLMILGMLLETLGFSLLLPALALMTQNDLVNQYPFLRPFLDYLGNPSTNELIVIGMIMLAIVYTIKALFLGTLAWLQAKFAFAVQANVSQRLFKNYLFQPYTFHLQHNSAQLIRNTTNEVSMFNAVTQSALMIIAEGLVFLGIATLLLFIEPVGACLVITLLGLAGWSFHKLTKNMILKWGEARQFHEGLRVQHLQQGLGGVKEVKLMGRENEFLSQFRIHNYGSAKIGEFQTTVKSLPRYWLELLAVIGLVTLVMVMMEQNKPMSSIVPTLGVFVAAAFRVMPSVNRVLSAFQTLRFATPVVNMLYEQLHLVAEHKHNNVHAPFSIKNSIELKDVSFAYPETASFALNSINISIPQGSMTGFIGTTGAGKSTLVDIILGLIHPTKGTVFVDNTDIQKEIRSWQDLIGYVPQSIFLTDDTLLRNVAFGIPIDQVDEEKVWSALRSAQLDSFVRELSLGLNTVVGERGVRLSGGQRQRIGIARALYHEPQILILDEATSSLDIDTEHDVMNAVNAMHGDKTIIIVTHRLTTVENCDLLYRLEKGRVVKEGSPESMFKTISPAGAYSS